MKKDKRFHIDDTPVVDVINDLDKGGYELPVNTEPSQVTWQKFL